MKTETKKTRFLVLTVALYCWVTFFVAEATPAETVEYDKLVTNLKEEPKFIVPDDTSFYLRNGWTEGKKLFHQLTEKYPEYISEQELGRYEFGILSLSTKEGLEHYTEKDFLSVAVPATDSLKLIMRALYGLEKLKEEELSFREKEAREKMYWGWIESAQQTKLPIPLPDFYSIWAYEVHHPDKEKRSKKYVFLLGGIDGPSEPGGTVSYANLILRLIKDPDWQPLLAEYTFCILPNANPLSLHRYSPYGEGGIHIIFDGKWDYEIVNLPSGNIGSVFHQEDNQVFEVRMVRKWVAQVNPDQIVGLISQQGTSRGAFALAPNPGEFPELSKSEKNRVYPTLVSWARSMKILDIPLDPSVKTVVEGEEVSGVGIHTILGIPTGHFSNQGIFGMLVECGYRHNPNNMANSVRTVIGALLAILKEYEYESVDK